MTEIGDERDRPSGPVPLSLRRRAGNLFEGRRRRILEEPLAALRATGRPIEVSDRSLGARAAWDDGTVVEVAFVSNRRLFGLMIDTMWVARRGEVKPGLPVVSYRFKDRTFFAAKDAPGHAVGVAETFAADRKVADLIAKSEVKTLRVLVGESGRQVELVPQPGTITAVFLPPLPPYTVPMRPQEAAAHLLLVRRLLDL